MIRYAQADDGLTMPGNDQRLVGQLPWLRKLPPDIATILDVGAGAGSHSRFFHSLGLSVTAIDADATNFRFSEEIEFIEGDVLSWNDGRKFDAVFCSHVFEHVPDLGSFIQKLRALIRDGGYLLAVVPRYEGLSCDEHWHIGWNCSQLALTLTASGFDCSAAAFAELNENVCGWGQKRDFRPTHFNIAESAPFLPKGMRKAIFAAGSGNLHLADLIYADGDEVRHRRRRFDARVDAFRDDDALELQFRTTGEREDETFTFDPPLDFSRSALAIATLQEGGDTVLRIALDSSESDDLAEASEFYLDQIPGFSALSVHWYDFRRSTGHTRFDRVRRMVIGGTGHRTRVRCWIYLDGAPLTRRPMKEPQSSRGQSSLDGVPASRAADASQIYFLRNRALRLERDLNRLNAELESGDLRRASAGPALPSADDLRVMLNAALRGLRTSRVLPGESLEPRQQPGKAGSRFFGRRWRRSRGAP